MRHPDPLPLAVCAMGIAQITARTAYVKLVAPREPDPNRIAIAGSWV